MNNIDDISMLKHGLIKFKDKNSNLYGFMNSIGKIIIDPKFLNVSDFDDDHLAIEKLEGGMVTLINNEGHRVTKDNYVYISSVKNSVRIVAKKNNNPFVRYNPILYGLIGRINLPCKYKEIKMFDSGLGYAKDIKGRYYIIGSTPAMLINKKLSHSYVESEPVYITENGTISCADGKNYYYTDAYNSNGDDIKLAFKDLDLGYGINGEYTYPMFDEAFIYDKKRFRYTAIVNVKRRFEDGYDPCLIDEAGNVLIEPYFSGSYENYCYRIARNSHGFYDGIFLTEITEIKDKRRRYGVVNREGKVIISPKYYEKAVILDNLIIFGNDYYDYSGNLLRINPKYKKIFYEKDNDILIASLENGKYVYLDTSFNELFDGECFDYCMFPKDNIFIAGNYKIDLESNDNYRYLEYTVYERKNYDKNNRPYLNELSYFKKLFTYPTNEDALDEIESLKYIRSNDKNVFYGKFKNKFGSVIIRNGIIKIIPYIVTPINDKFFLACDFEHKGIVSIDGEIVIPVINSEISKLSDNLLLITYEGEKILFDTTIKSLPSENSYLAGIDYLDYYFNHNKEENFRRELDSNRDYVLKKVDKNASVLESYCLVDKRFMKKPITKEELFYMVDDGDNLFHFEIKDEYKGMLNYLDLSDINFILANISGLDLSKTNAKIDPDLVYKLDGCVFGSHNLGEFTSSTPVYLGDDSYKSIIGTYKLIRKL